MAQRLPPLSSLRLFEAAARLKSFKHAAEELALTPSAVSHGVQTLERWLERPLFIRSPAGLQLTETGASYYPIVKDALALLISGTQEVTGQRASLLSISAAPTFAARWLLPRLADFRRHHQDLEVTVDTAREAVDLRSRSVDLAIRMGKGDWPGLAKTHLFTEELVPLCSPEMRARMESTSDLKKLPLIHLSPASEDWVAWAAAAGFPIPDPSGGFSFDTLQMAFEAAAQGLGIVIGRKPLVNQELSQGRLVEIWQPAIKSKTAYWLVTLEERAHEPHIRMFRDWIVDRCASECNGTMANAGITET